MKKILSRLILAATLLGLTASVKALPQETFAESADVESKLRFAAGQHEIIRILLEQGRFSEILTEYRKILELELQGENEEPVVKEAWFVVERLRQSDQYSLAHAVVDESLGWLRNQESKFYLLIMKGKIFYDEGRTLEAIEAYRRAQEFQD
jgi:tetratricopeptide (TPR) repeat protein